MVCSWRTGPNGAVSFQFVTFMEFIVQAVQNMVCTDMTPQRAQHSGKPCAPGSPCAAAVTTVSKQAEARQQATQRRLFSDVFRGLRLGSHQATSSPGIWLPSPHCIPCFENRAQSKSVFCSAKEPHNFLFLSRCERSRHRFCLWCRRLLEERRCRRRRTRVWLHFVCET